MHKAAIILLETLSFFIIATECTDFENWMQNVTVVHLVSMNHLDVGFNHGEYTDHVPPYTPTCGYAYSVINVYFDVFFPEAIRTAEELRTQGKQRLVYTTHPWLLDLYLFNCPTYLYGPIHCPNETSKASLEEAVRRGDIAWHAFPFNTQPYLTSVQRLNKHFGIAGPTLTLSQRDVPGMTQAVIPLLVKAGLKAISIGANEAVPPADVPRIFLWQDALQEHEIITMYHPGGYGGILPTDCVHIDNFTEVLCLAFKGDNRGPPSVEEVAQSYEQLKQEFPGALIQGTTPCCAHVTQASTFDSFVTAVIKANAQRNLPVISQEMGDKVQSDPKKVAQFRAIFRLRHQCIEKKQCKEEDWPFQDFSRLLFKVIEHTWGMDIKNFLKDWGNWSNVLFDEFMGRAERLYQCDGTRFTSAYIQYAIAALQKSHKYLAFAKEIRYELENLEAHKPSLVGYTKVLDWNKKFSCGRFDIGFDATFGAISHLVDNKLHRNWASPSNLLGLVEYDTYDAEDFQIFLDSYLYCKPPTCYWGPLDFGKPGLESASPNHTVSWVAMDELWSKEDSKGYHFISILSLQESLSTNYGAPKLIYLEVTIPKDSAQSRIEFTFQWFDKRPTRLPESLWIIFNPLANQSQLWEMNKLGQYISPLNVMYNGTRRLHGINKGVVYDRLREDDSYLFIESKDIALFSPGRPSLLNFTNEEPDLQEGIYWNCFNNMYDSKYVLFNTQLIFSYIMWYPFVDKDKDQKFRFVLHFD